jgi:hypothetical protein
LRWKTNHNKPKTHARRHHHSTAKK